MAEDQLQQLRTRIVGNLGDMSDQLAASDTVDLNTLLVIAHSTGRQELLTVAYDRIQAITDPSERAEAYLDLLDEVDYSLRERKEAATASPEAPAHDAVEQPAQ